MHSVFVLTLVELPLYALIIGWVFERANRSMAVAIALHAGAHIDHIEWAPRTGSDLGLHVLHIVVLAAVAAAAAGVVLAPRGGQRRVTISSPVVPPGPSADPRACRRGSGAPGSDTVVRYKLQSPASNINPATRNTPERVAVANAASPLT